MITIKNLRSEQPNKPWQVHVDRTSVLGNPFHMYAEHQRNAVCDAYQKAFDAIIKVPNAHQAFMNELRRLYKIHKQYGKLELFCWCAPKRCHAETIKNYLEQNEYRERMKEWTEAQDWHLIQKVFRVDGEHKEYSIGINGIGFAVSDFHNFEKEFIDLIAKYRI